jgi:hypothetical protein
LRPSINKSDQATVTLHDEGGTPSTCPTRHK